MKKDDILNSLDNVDEELLKEAENYRPKKQYRSFVKWATAAACAGLVVLAGTKHLPQLAKKSTKTAESGINYCFTFDEEQKFKDQTVIGQAVATPTPVLLPGISDVIATDVTFADEGFGIWNEKDVTYLLEEQLNGAENDEKVTIVLRPYFQPWESDFVCEGKTIAQYYREMSEEKNYPEKLLQLLKEGDSLKYGDALYLEGTPDGERWTREWYEKRCGDYGEAVLNKYIQNGSFLREQCEQDAEAARNAHEATDRYQKALECAKTVWLEEIAATLDEVVKRSGDNLVFRMTKADFAEFTCDYYCVYGTVQSNTKVPYDAEDCADE